MDLHGETEIGANLLVLVLEKGEHNPESLSAT